MVRIRRHIQKRNAAIFSSNGQCLLQMLLICWPQHLFKVSRNVRRVIVALSTTTTARILYVLSLIGSRDRNFTSERSLVSCNRLLVKHTCEYNTKNRHLSAEVRRKWRMLPDEAHLLGTARQFTHARPFHHLWLSNLSAQPMNTLAHWNAQETTHPFLRKCFFFFVQNTRVRRKGL